LAAKFGQKAITAKTNIPSSTEKHFGNNEEIRRMMRGDNIFNISSNTFYWAQQPHLPSG
jgi:hypothetical protein